MANFNKTMYELGSNRSVIRELFEYGKKMAAEQGADKVFDFSLGNPNVPAPKCVNETIVNLLATMDSTALHGYTSAQGDFETREAIADSIKRRFSADISANNIYMTCGAAASLCITLRALNQNDDEFIALAPYFPEYKVFVEAQGGVFKPVPLSSKGFEIDFEEFENSITKKTKAVIINSPNNPAGVVYGMATLTRICDILKRKGTEFGHNIYIIADEPYRELVYDKMEVPYIMNCYDDTIVCYSYSKSLSLPGERIGYIAVSPKAKESEAIYAAVCGAGRALGYVCAPSLMQKVVARCVDAKPDIEAYKMNRDLLFNTLTGFGYQCVRPDGAFYLFVKSLEPDSNSFCNRAKELGLLVVPGDDFGAPGYVRIAYCVSYNMIERSLPAFKLLYNQYKQN